MSGKSSGNKLQSIERMFTILSALRELDGARISEVSEQSGLANSSIHRHLNTLKEMGYVVKDGDVYAIGLGFLDLGEYARNRREIYKLAKPKIREIAEETGERCQLCVEENGQAVYLYFATGSNAVETDARIGKQLHLHSTAVGKSILAQLPEQRVDSIIKRWGLPKQTDKTITTREELDDELERVREEGVAYNRGGNTDRLCSVGCPIFSPSGQVVGAISISGPARRMKGEKYHKRFPDLLLGAANEIELNLQYQ